LPTMPALARPALHLLLMLCLCLQAWAVHGATHAEVQIESSVDGDCPLHAAMKAEAAAKQAADVHDCSEGECRCCPCALALQPALSVAAVLLPPKLIDATISPPPVWSLHNAPYVPLLRPPIG
jgi:hypothetical protein